MRQSHSDVLASLAAVRAASCRSDCLMVNQQFTTLHNGIPSCRRCWTCEFGNDRRLNTLCCFAGIPDPPQQHHRLAGRLQQAHDDAAGVGCWHGHHISLRHWACKGVLAQPRGCWPSTRLARVQCIGTAQIGSAYCCVATWPAVICRAAGVAAGILNKIWIYNRSHLC